MPEADASSIHSEPMIDLLRELALDLGARSGIATLTIFGARSIPMYGCSLAIPG